WREMTLGTPALWTVVSSQDPFSHVEQALQLSSPMPLDVLYHFGQSTEFSVPIFFGEVSQMSSRWRRLDIAHNGNSGELDWMEEASMPILEHLHLERDLDEDEGTIARPLNLF
ncbi:hypothetical protein FRC01_010060, partial [Tulasnella sp. 417]